MADWQYWVNSWTWAYLNFFQPGQFYNSKLVFRALFKTLTKLNICVLFLSAEVI